MPFSLTNPDLEEPDLGTFDTMDDLRRAAVSWFRASYPDAPVEDVLLIASYIYSDENWVRDPFGTALYCHCSTRMHSDGTNVVTEPPSFFARQA